MDFAHLDQQLRDSLLDLKLSNEERDELRQLGSELGQDQVRYMRNRAFDLVRELALANSATTGNEENLLVIDHPQLVASYLREFNELWARYAPR